MVKLFVSNMRFVGGIGRCVIVGRLVDADFSENVVDDVYYCDASWMDRQRHMLFVCVCRKFKIGKRKVRTPLLPCLFCCNSSVASHLQSLPSEYKGHILFALLEEPLGSGNGIQNPGGSYVVWLKTCIKFALINR